MFKEWKYSIWKTVSVRIKKFDCWMAICYRWWLKKTTTDFFVQSLPGTPGTFLRERRFRILVWESQMWTNGNGFKRLVNKNRLLQNWLDLSLRVLDNTGRPTVWYRIRKIVSSSLFLSIFPLKPDPNSAFGLTPHASRQKQYQQQQQYQTERKQRKFQLSSSIFHGPNDFPLINYEPYFW